VLPGLIGTIQATETIKLVTGIGEPLVGRLMVYDALRMSFDELKLRKDPDCPVCGSHPTVGALVDYDAFCGLAPPAQERSTVSAELDFNITVDDLKARMDRGNGPFLLDVREPFEYQIASIGGAVLIPMGDLARRQQELDPDEEIVVYCHHGLRSANVTSFLRQHGFSKARNLQGGIERWAAQVDPAMARY
jgi:adenylyltransferase/sulfurtransferase